MRSGYSPIPVIGKRCLMKGWQTKLQTNDEEIELWNRLWPDHTNTGLLCAHTPGLDLDLLDQDAAEAAEALVRERFEERGRILVRVGLAPKRLILFRTNDLFKKIAVDLIAANGSKGQKIELLADGEQFVGFGIPPDTGKPYSWFGGAPGEIARDDLPYLHEAEARQLVEDCVELVCREQGYRRAAKRRKGAARKDAPNGGDPGGGADDWGYLVENIINGRSLHDSLRDLAGKYVRSGMSRGAAVNCLRGLMDKSAAARDQRWQDRYRDIPRLVESAAGPQEERKPDLLAPSTIEKTIEVFQRWLLLGDLTPVYAVLGTVAANLLPGDPVWLGLIGPPSSAKTEILNSTLKLPHVVQAATLTPAGLLSGTPKKQKEQGAKGGLLRLIAEFGIIVLKDFGSILSMRPDAKAEVLAALREVYDGAWTRHIGTDGGKTLEWKGKVGLLFGATGVIDSHYSVIGAMGDRFLLSRLAPADKGQFARALKHQGDVTKQMRGELAEAVACLFAAERPKPQPISQEEIERLDRAISLVVRLRGAVERDRYSREIEAVYGAEGTARIGLALERLLAGLATLGLDRATAFDVVEAVALDSVPPLRRRAFEHLQKSSAEIDTKEIARALDLPTNTVRRALEDLAAYRLITRNSQGQGKADLWAVRGEQTGGIEDEENSQT